MSTATQVGLRIGNAVRKIEGIYVPRNGRGLVQMPFDHPFKVWVKSTGVATFAYAVCEIDPDVVTDPVSLAGRVWVPDETCYEIATLTWTAVTESGWVFLDFTDPATPAFDFIAIADEITTPLTADQIPIAEISIVGSLAQVRQLQFGDIVFRGNNRTAPVKLTSKTSSTIYVGDVYENGTDATATAEDVNIHVRELSDGDGGYLQLPFNVDFTAHRQKWSGVYMWTLINVPVYDAALFECPT